MAMQSRQSRQGRIHFGQHASCTGSLAANVQTRMEKIESLLVTEGPSATDAKAGEGDAEVEYWKRKVAELSAPLEGVSGGGKEENAARKSDQQGAVLFELTAASLSQLEAAQPAVSAVFHKILMRIMARQVSWAHGF